MFRIVEFYPTINDVTSAVRFFILPNGIKGINAHLSTCEASISYKLFEAGTLSAAAVFCLCIMQYNRTQIYN